MHQPSTDARVKYVLDRSIAVGQNQDPVLLLTACASTFFLKMSYFSFFILHSTHTRLPVLSALNNLHSISLPTLCFTADTVSVRPSLPSTNIGNVVMAKDSHPHGMCLLSSGHH